MFRPIESIRKRIDSFTPNFQQQETIGIHIRRTDHRISIQESPTELFFERIDERLRISPNTSFYLATDSEEEKAVFIERYGNKIYTLNEKADRTNYSGMQHAVTEFFLLSHTKEIWGTSQSSFSEMAALAGDIPLSILKIKPSY